MSHCDAADWEEDEEPAPPEVPAQAAQEAQEAEAALAADAAQAAYNHRAEKRARRGCAGKGQGPALAGPKPKPKPKPTYPRLRRQDPQGSCAGGARASSSSESEDEEDKKKPEHHKFTVGVFNWGGGHRANGEKEYQRNLYHLTVDVALTQEMEEYQRDLATSETMYWSPPTAERPMELPQQGFCAGGDIVQK